MSRSRLDQLTAAFLAQLPRRRRAIVARLAADDCAAALALVREVADGSLTYGLFELSDACVEWADVLARVCEATACEATAREALVAQFDRAVEATIVGGAGDELAG